MPIVPKISVKFAIESLILNYRDSYHQVFEYSIFPIIFKTTNNYEYKTP